MAACDFLGRDEFAKAMHAMGLRLTPEELKELFDSYDVDGNGTIDTKEFAQMVRKHLGKKEAEASSTHNGSAVNSIQNWHSDDSTHSPAAAVLQKWARAALARVKQTHVRRYFCLPSTLHAAGRPCKREQKY